MDMDLEHRVEKIEREVEVLKDEIRGTLLDVQESLLGQPTNSSPARKRAWLLALVNLLLAIALFTNVRFYTSGASADGGSLVDPWEPWLRILWVVLAFVWLILQMYPLVLLLGQEDTRSYGAVLRNAIGLITSNPRLTAVLGLLTLVVAILSALFPWLWLVGMMVLLVFLCLSALRGILKNSGFR